MLEEGIDGGHNVTVPVLDGCYTQSNTIDKALENAKDAIICHLEGLEKLNKIKR